MSPINVFFYGLGLTILFLGTTLKVVANTIERKFSDGLDYAEALRTISSLSVMGSFVFGLSVGLSELAGTPLGMTLVIGPLLVWLVIGLRATMTQIKLKDAREADSFRSKWQY